MNIIQTELQGDRYRWPVLTKELDDRLNKFQSLLEKLDIDCAIVQSQSTVLDGVIRYFIDQTTGLYSSSLLIPRKGKMFYLVHGNEIGSTDVPNHIRNVEMMFLSPYCQTFNFSDGMAAKAISNEIIIKGYKKIGYIAPQLMSFDYLNTLMQDLRNHEFTDISSDFYKLRAIKSPVEWELINESIKVHDKLMYMVPSIIRPGMKEHEIRSEIARACINLGADSAAFVAVGSGPQGRKAQYTGQFSCNRTVEKGDNICVMIEICGPGGIYGELARTFTLGEPGDSILKLYEIAKGCQKEIAKAIKPGVTGAEVNKVFNEYVEEFNIGPNLRFGGHGMGYDMMEAPAINQHETMTFEEDMYLVLHPELIAGGEFVTCSDNFKVTKDGAVRLSKFPQEIIVL